MRGLLALCVLAFAATPADAGDVLFDAIAAGNKAAVEQALADGADVDSRARDQATPLIAAALDDQLAIAELLLSKGADVMARNSGGFTPLHAAAFSGSLPIAKLLLEKGAVLEDSANKSGVTPLMVAGEENHVELAEFLIAQRRGCEPSRGSWLLADHARVLEGQYGHHKTIQTPWRHLPGQDPRRGERCEVRSHPRLNGERR